MARLRRLAMMRGPLAVRTWERSSPESRSRTQCSRSSMPQWRRRWPRGLAELGGSSCSTAWWSRHWSRSKQRQGRSRYRLLETIREYAAERLEAAGADEEVRRRHGEHFVEVAQRSRPDFVRFEGIGNGRSWRCSMPTATTCMPQYAAILGDVGERWAPPEGERGPQPLGPEPGGAAGECFSVHDFAGSVRRALTDSCQPSLPTMPSRVPGPRGIYT